MEMISSVNNETVKRVASLSEKKYRKQNGTFLVESYKLVSEVVGGSMELVKLYVEQSVVDKYTDIIKKCEPNVVVLSQAAFNKISDTVSSQGIIAEVKMKDAKEFDFSEPFIILDRISDPGNMGTIIRTAAAVGYKNIVLINCSDPYNPKTVRSSAGGIFYTNFHQISFDELMEKVKKANAGIYIADMNGENVFNLKATDKVYGLVIGNEGGGISEAFRKNATKVISLPMKSQMESLNAAVSGSVIMYQLKKDEF